MNMKRVTVPESTDISGVLLILAMKLSQSPHHNARVWHSTVVLRFCPFFPLSLPLLVDEGSSVLLEVLRTSHFVCPSACVCACLIKSMCVCVCMWGMERGLGSCSVFCPSLSLIFSPFPNQLHSVPVLPF